MPAKPYILEVGTKVPGVTTVIGRWKESGGLIHWAWALGMEGKDYRQVRDSAADAGTCAHAMVECDIRNKPFDEKPWPKETLEKAWRAFGAYQEWKDQTRLVPIASELSLISEQHRFGGTLDAMLINGKTALGDWKTSNAVYQDYLIQLAAYGYLWNEHNPDNQITGGYHLLRFSKNEGDFVHYYFAELDVAWCAFLHMRALYDLDKQLKERIR